MPTCIVWYIVKPCCNFTDWNIYLIIRLMRLWESYSAKHETKLSYTRYHLIAHTLYNFSDTSSNIINSHGMQHRIFKFMKKCGYSITSGVAYYQIFFIKWNFMDLLPINIKMSMFRGSFMITSFNCMIIIIIIIIIIN